MNTIIKLIITAVVAYLLPNVLSGVHVTTFSAAIIFAIVLGLLNLFVKPILHLFSLVINAIIVLIADYFIDGINIDGFLWALIFSVALSIVTSILESIFISKE